MPPFHQTDHPPSATSVPAFPPATPGLRRPGGPTRVIVLVAVAAGALESTQAWLVNQARGTPQTLVRAIAINMPWWLLWGALALAAIRLARRFPLGRPLRRSVPLHLAASIVFSLIHLAGVSMAILAAPGAPPGVGRGFVAQFRLLATGYFMMELLTYWVILGGYSAWVGSVRTRQSEEARRALAVEAAEAEAGRARLERQMMEARLHALRTELNPHFLFNSLNGVSALARTGDVDGAVTMIARLGELLRRTLESEQEGDCTVADEIDVVGLYLAVERVRYGSRLEVVEAVADACRDVLMPPFLLQPLVENAVRHGVAAVDRTVRIEISAAVHRGRLEIRVADSGPGRTNPDGRDAEERGVGLRNVRERLATLYGSRAALRVYDRPGGGWVASVSLPAEHVESVRVERASGAGS